MRVLILGGGYAGVTLARELETSLPDTDEILLIDEDGTHVIQHQLHRLIRFPELKEHLCIPLTDILERTQVVPTSVTAIDEEQLTVTTAGGERYYPDVLAICIGAKTQDYGIPGIKEFGQPLKQPQHAQTIRRKARSLSASQQVIIGGAGLSGIQVAGELAELVDANHGGPTVMLLEQEQTIAPGFPRSFQEAVHTELVDHGVDIATGETVVQASKQTVTVREDREIPCDQFVWTGGITGHAPMDHQRPSVRSDLRLGPRTFVAGDVATIIDARGTTVPASAQTAIRQAKVAAENITRLIRGERQGNLVFEPRLQRYAFDSAGWVVSVGDEAIAQFGDRVYRGTAAKAIKTGVGVGYLNSIGRYRDAIELLGESVGSSTLQSA